MDEFVRYKITIGVHIELALEHLGVGVVSNAEEHGVGREIPNHTGLHVAELESCHLFLRDIEDVFDDRVHEEFNFRIFLRALEHDFGGAEFFAAMDQGYLASEAGQERGFFHGGVAAADDCYGFAGKEEAVAGGTGRDAVADEGLFVR